MPKHPSPQRVKRHQIYTVWEAADAVGTHRQTVIRWIKDKGLSADTSQRPWLIEGKEFEPPRFCRRLFGLSHATIASSSICA